ncbi:MAG: lipoprotein insertase outer membrane protein LolB [Betaproteobacteria bacterium]|nr:lipoprotein insertase outer membrane protein LolB [Betaproteobacteria bacterium]
MMPRRLLALAVALAVAACAALQPAAPPAPPFDLSGRVLVSYDRRAFAAGLRWRHTPPQDEISLLTPLGQTIAHIENGADGATLTGADRRSYHAASVESLTRQALGWEFPLAHLRHWVRGEPAPGSVPNVLERDAGARLTLLEQEGWRIMFTHYPLEQHGGRPRRLELDHAAQRIRLVIDEWRAEGAAK